MNIQFYPLIYTATRGLDYDLWLSPPDITRDAVDICRRCMADDLYGMSHKAKRLYVKTTDYLLWGVSISNSMMIALDPYYYTDAFNRPIRGFYGVYIPLDSESVIPKTLPLDFDEGLPFTQNMLFEPFVQPYWTINSRSELKQTASLQNMTLEDDCSLQQNVSALDSLLPVPAQGFYYGLAPRNDENLNRIIQSFVRSQKNAGIVTGVESLTQARDLAKMFNIQFIELVNTTEDSEIEIDPKPARPPVVESDCNSYSNEDESEEEEWDFDFSSPTSFDYPASNRRNRDIPFTRQNPFRNLPSSRQTELSGKKDIDSLQGNIGTDNSSSVLFKPHDNYDVYAAIMHIKSWALNLFSNGNNNVQNNPLEKEKQMPEIKDEPPSVFQQKLSKSEEKPFVAGRRTMTVNPHNPAFENRPDSAFSDDYDNNPKLSKIRFLPNLDNDVNDPNNENDTF